MGLTPEGYVALFLDGLERGRRAADIGPYSYLNAAFLPASRLVPYAHWFPVYGRAILFGGGPDGRYDVGGARAAVRACDS